MKVFGGFPQRSQSCPQSLLVLLWDDVDEIAALLNLGTQPTLNLLHDLDQ